MAKYLVISSQYYVNLSQLANIKQWFNNSHFKDIIFSLLACINIRQLSTSLPTKQTHNSNHKILITFLQFLSFQLGYIKFYGFILANISAFHLIFKNEIRKTLFPNEKLLFWWWTENLPINITDVGKFVSQKNFFTCITKHKVLVKVNNK